MQYNRLVGIHSLHVADGVKGHFLWKHVCTLLRDNNTVNLWVKPDVELALFFWVNIRVLWNTSNVDFQGSDKLV